jgi:nitric oxide reductase large subunit
MSTTTPVHDAKRWALLGGVLVFTFLLLGFFGREVYRQAPPIPERVVTPDGTTLMTKDDILTGQKVWQSAGGQQLGSIWGHGAYQAPDWTADAPPEAVRPRRAGRGRGCQDFAALSADRQPC